jgi:putative flippase GtrA
MAPPEAEGGRGIAGKAGRYLVTGSVAAIVDIGVFSALFALGVAVPIGATVAFLVATVCNYWISAPFVFGAGRSLGGYLRFLAAAAFGFLINVGLTIWLPGPLALLLPAALVVLLPPLPIVAKVIAIGVAFVFNFAVNLLVVFRPQR